MNTPVEKEKSKYDTSVLQKKYEESPFMAEGRFQVPIRNKSEKLDTAGPLALMDTQTGEVQDVAEVRRVRNVDSERFVKLFVGQLHVFFDLKPGTVKLVTALIDELSQTRYMNGDQIYLNYNSVKKYFSKNGAKAPARTTYLTALAELVEKGFVAPSVDANLFFINPAIFFNGDRVRFVTEIRRKRSKQEKLEDLGQQRLDIDPSDISQGEGQ